jgi:hypothetical protein
MEYRRQLKRKRKSSRIIRTSVRSLNSYRNNDRQLLHRAGFDSVNIQATLVEIPSIFFIFHL